MRQARGRCRLLAVLLVAAPLGTACHSRSPSASSSASPVPASALPVPATDDPDTAVALEIANHNWSDVVIYVLRDGQPSRIGIATAASATSFLLPRRMLGPAGDIRLWGRPIGARDAAFTETVVVQPGQWIEWTLESDLSRSAVGVY
jgi:hypothetical protein